MRYRRSPRAALPRAASRARPDRRWRRRSCISRAAELRSSVAFCWVLRPLSRRRDNPSTSSLSVVVLSPRQAAPVLHDLPPAKLADRRLPKRRVVLFVFGLGQAKMEQPAVGIDLVAAEPVEFVDRGSRDALAGLIGRLGGRGIAGGLDLLPELQGGGIGLLAAALRDCRRREEGDRRGDGAGGGTHDEAVEQHAAV